MDAKTTPEPVAGSSPERARAHKLYRRRQRQRAIIAWSVAGLLVVAVGLAVALGGEGESAPTATSIPGLFVSEMSSSQYEQIQKGQDESQVLGEIGVPGEQESEVEDPEVLQLFPPEPAGSTCRFWKLSDAPEHTVRLCFSSPQGGVLLQKTVAALGEDAAPRTLV